MKNWFVLQTKPHKEATVENLLKQAGIQVYFPRIKEDDRIQPFFPCYEFAYFNFPSQYRLVRYTRGVRRVVGNEQGPIPIEAALIQEIKSREVDGFIVLEEVLEPPSPGDLIEVVKGPWRGVKGIFQRSLSGAQRVMILLNYVNYQASLILPRSQIRKARR